MKKLLLNLIILQCICLLFITSANATKKYECSPKDTKNIKIVTAHYLNDKKHSAIPSDQADIFVNRCIKNYALVTVHPKQPVTDNAFAYLHKVKNTWKVMSLGTHFDEDFLRQIPVELRDYSK